MDGASAPSAEGGPAVSPVANVPSSSEDQAATEKPVVGEPDETEPAKEEPRTRIEQCNALIETINRRQGPLKSA